MLDGNEMERAMPVLELRLRRYTMVRKDFAGLVLYLIYALQTISKLVAGLTNLFPTIAVNTSMSPSHLSALVKCPR